MNELLHSDQKHEKRHGVSNRDDTLWIALSVLALRTLANERFSPLCTYVKDEANSETITDLDSILSDIEMPRETQGSTQTSLRTRALKQTKIYKPGRNVQEPYRRQSHREGNIM